MTPAQRTIGLLTLGFALMGQAGCQRPVPRPGKPIATERRGQQTPAPPRAAPAAHPTPGPP